jgi:sulfoxide reductase catalytic subunit YedY
MKKIFEHQITDEKHYINRREFIQKTSGLGIGLATFSGLAEAKPSGERLKNIIKTDYGQNLTSHSFKQISSYNNFYEFGTGKRAPAKNAHTLKTKPWHVAVSGECGKAGNYDLEDFIAPIN